MQRCARSHLGQLAIDIKRRPHPNLAMPPTVPVTYRDSGWFKVYLPGCIVAEGACRGAEQHGWSKQQQREESRHVQRRSLWPAGCVLPVVVRCQSATRRFLMHGHSQRSNVAGCGPTAAASRSRRSAVAPVRCWPADWHRWVSDRRIAACNTWICSMAADAVACTSCRCCLPREQHPTESHFKPSSV